MPREHDRFVNWSRGLRSAPLRWHLPRSEDEVVDLVARCARAGRALRPVGAGHSWSPVGLPELDAVCLDQLTGTPVISPDRDEVSAPAGLRLDQLSSYLDEHGLALPIVGSVQAQSLAGAIATATHGSSLRHGNLSALVTAVRLVNGRGEVEQIGADDLRLDGARVHLGALGVLTSVTFRVRPAFRLQQSIEAREIDDVVATLPEIAASAPWVKVWWLPQARQAHLVRWHETTAPSSRRPSARTRRWVDERVLHRWLFPGLVAVQHRRPNWVAGINERLSRVYLGPPTQVGPAPLLLTTPMPLRHRETEAAVALADAGEALRRVVGICRDGRPAANFPLELRFVPADTGWLSPAYGRDSCQLGAYSTDGRHTDAYFRAFWSALCELGARAHWGKELPGGDLASGYPQRARFAALRAELDPQAIFAHPVARQLDATTTRRRSAG